ncbi:hypothetical protein HYDPIDRAFT_120286, partial [Hydnomerulius pinastri MD-312]
LPLVTGAMRILSRCTVHFTNAMFAFSFAVLRSTQSATDLRIGDIVIAEPDLAIHGHSTYLHNSHHI